MSRTPGIAVLTLILLAHPARAERDFGIGTLIPQKFVGEVRKGSEDKMPAVPEVPESPAAVAKAPAVKPPPFAVAAQPTVNPPPAAVAAQPAFNSPASVPANTVRSFAPVAAAPIVAPNAVPSSPMLSNPPARPAIMGSVGDAPAPSLPAVGQGYGLGAGWGLDGNRREGSAGAEVPLSMREVPKSEEGSARQDAADRLLASIQSEPQPERAPNARTTGEPSVGEAYRSLNSVLAFQEIPRGSLGAEPKPKTFWEDPNPVTQVRTSAKALETVHSKEALGADSVSARHASTGGSNGGSGLGSTNGLYSNSSSGGGSGNPAAAALPFQLPFATGNSIPADQ